MAWQIMHAHQYCHHLAHFVQYAVATYVIWTLHLTSNLQGLEVCLAYEPAAGLEPSSSPQCKHAAASTSMLRLLHFNTCCSRACILF